jgi:hypothetical protein
LCRKNIWLKEPERKFIPESIHVSIRAPWARPGFRKCISPAYFFMFHQEQLVGRTSNKNKMRSFGSPGAARGLRRCILSTRRWQFSGPEFVGRSLPSLPPEGCCKCSLPFLPPAPKGEVFGPLESTPEFIGSSLTSFPPVGCCKCWLPSLPLEGCCKCSLPFLPPAPKGEVFGPLGATPEFIRWSFPSLPPVDAVSARCLFCPRPLKGRSSDRLSNGGIC